MLFQARYDEALAIYRQNWDKPGDMPLKHSKIKRRTL
jgi:hypothetical protein